MGVLHYPMSNVRCRRRDCVVLGSLLLLTSLFHQPNDYSKFSQAEAFATKYSLKIVKVTVTQSRDIHGYRKVPTSIVFAHFRLVLFCSRVYKPPLSFPYMTVLILFRRSVFQVAQNFDVRCIFCSNIVSKCHLPWFVFAKAS